MAQRELDTEPRQEATVVTEPLDIPDPPADPDELAPTAPWPSWTSRDRYHAALAHALRAGVTEDDLDDLWVDIRTPYTRSLLAILANQTLVMALMLGLGTLIGQLIQHPQARTPSALDPGAARLIVGAVLAAVVAALVRWINSIVENRLRARRGYPPRVRGSRPPWKVLRLAVWFSLVHAAQIAAAARDGVRLTEPTLRAVRRLRNAADAVDADLARSLRLPSPRRQEEHTAAALARHLRDLADRMLGSDLERAAGVADGLAALLPLVGSEVAWLGFAHDGSAEPGLPGWRRHRRAIELGAAGVLLAATVVLSLTHLPAASIVCAVLSAAVAGGLPAVESIAQTWARPPETPSDGAAT
ncbi:hypothetical protein AB0I55_20400 [Actinocatenispora sera]|uniref:hypothetical protein n=1 Tax=Actinocatenispora sera TaxID=390989 RepID=UPI0033CE2CD1